MDFIQADEFHQNLRTLLAFLKPNLPYSFMHDIQILGSTAYILLCGWVARFCYFTTVLGVNLFCFLDQEGEGAEAVTKPSPQGDDLAVEVWAGAVTRTAITTGWEEMVSTSVVHDKIEGFGSKDGGQKISRSESLVRMIEAF